MVDSFDDAEFWLPPQFLTDEDFLMDGKSCTQGAAGGDGLCLGRGPGSGLSSPVDSPLGSLETESDEEDLMAELSRMMAHSTLEDGFGAADSKVRIPSGSPQSTLCPGWDSCEAAGEVARPRLSEQLYGLGRSRGTGEPLYGAPGRRSPIPVPEKAHNCDGRFNYLHHQHSLFHQHLVANQIQRLKQQRAMMMKQQQQPRANWELNIKLNSQAYHAVETFERKPDSARGGGTRRPLVGPAASAWPSMQQQNGASMRAVFLGPNGKRGCAGTGVFLPRRAGSHSETRKKSACSTVLLPDKVVRALNLNLEKVGSQPHIQYCLNGYLSTENDCAWNLRRDGVTAQLNRKGHSQSASLNHEIRLPQDWTY